MPLISISEVRFYDPLSDSEAIRISGFSDRGGEFWIREALAPAGKSRRLQREKAMDAIAEAIAAGLEPGQVVIDG
jgi:hypothetical protein